MRQCHGVAVARRLAAALVAVAALAVVGCIVAAYLDPALRKAIVFAGFGLC